LRRRSRFDGGKGLALLEGGEGARAQLLFVDRRGLFGLRRGENRPRRPERSARLFERPRERLFWQDRLVRGRPILGRKVIGRRYAQVRVRILAPHDGLVSGPAEARRGDCREKKRCRLPPHDSFEAH
jgi:hypothetical protein